MYYCTAGNIGGQLNLAVWRLEKRLSNLNPSNLSAIYANKGTRNMYATTAKFKSANFFISAARDQTAKFKDRQYFQLYGMPDTNDHPQRGIYSVAIILGQQHYRREI